MNKEELLYNEIYERTKDFGRTQFVREMMRLQREHKELQQKVKQLEKENKHLYEKEELHLNRIDELTDRVVKLETNNNIAINFIDQVLQYHLCPFDYKQVDEDVNTLIGILRGKE